MDFEENKEDEEQGQWKKSSMDGGVLQWCDLSEIRGFHISPKGDGLEGMNSENVLTAMEASQMPFGSGVQIHDH